MPFCQQCSRLVALDTDQDPEVNDLDVDEDGCVTANVRIANACADCSTDLREYTFEMESEPGDEFVGHKGEGHELSVDEDTSEREIRTEGKGRSTKTFYGARVNVTVTCSCGKLGACVPYGFTPDAPETYSGVSVDLSAEVQASHMDEC